MILHVIQEIVVFLTSLLPRSPHHQRAWSHPQTIHNQRVDSVIRWLQGPSNVLWMKSYQWSMEYDIQVAAQDPGVDDLCGEAREVDVKMGIAKPVIFACIT